ncbi:Di-copper centre-containing protein [Tothia fuscella]|uniref:tyrosinase n=1 Tax=Tothia fuscella TaxID=1048955 RepID=A0A9P4P043_9PEZI|nr:Di-copper centre-containing protein [Tothia fuscella]
MRTSTILAALAVARSCLALPQSQDGLSKRADDTVSVTGVTADGVTGVRREIGELSTDKNAWNLYVLAMDKFVKSDTADILSFYQISGIHGMPCVPYSGVESNPEAIGQGACGYCTHSTGLFPPWHRAYNALYEQGFYEQVQAVVNEFSGAQKAAFQRAASGLRIAYWDWAATGAGDVPSILTQQKVTVPSPNGGSQSIDNPFYAYKFQVLNEAATGGYPWINWQNTLRYPTSGDASSVSDISSFVDNVKSAFTSVQALTYKMLLNCGKWEEMADDSARTSSDGCSAGLESIHDQIHMNIGGNGHMGDLGHASFDPIFWLHHTNVDRLASLWQIAQDKTWYTAGSSGVPTFTSPANEQAGGDYPLAPFYKDAGSQTFWTPNDLEDWTRLHYTYPEASNGLDTSKDSVIAAINKLYGTQTISTSSSTSSAVSSPTSAVSSTTSASAVVSSSAAASAVLSSSASVPAGVSSRGSAVISSRGSAIASPAIPSSFPSVQFGNASSTSRNGLPGLPTALPTLSLPTQLPSLSSLVPSLPSNLPDLLTPGGRQYDWACNVVAERMGLGGSFIIYVFFGDVPKDSSKWGTAKNLVGTHGVFGSKTMTAKSGWLVSGSVSLTAALVEKIAHGSLKGLDATFVEPYLAKNLNLAVKKASGEVVDNKNVPGFEVKPVSAKVTPAKDSRSAPVFGTPQGLGNGATGNFGYSGTFGSSGGFYGSNYGSGSGSKSGSGSSLSVGSSPQPTCIPQVEYVYEYTYV